MVRASGHATFATGTALRSFPPLVAMVKATHSRQRHDLGRG